MQTTSFEDIVKLQPKGLLTIPKKARQAAGFDEDGFVRIRVDRGRILIEPVRVLPYPVRRYTNEEIEKFFALDDKESEELRKKGLIK